MKTMSNAQLCIPALVLVLGSVFIQGDTVACSCLEISPEDRQPCGFPGISFDQCKAMSCCYDSRFSNIPSCYVNSVVEGIQQNQNENKEENKTPPTTEEEQKQKDLKAMCKKCEEEKGEGLLGLLGNLLGDSEPKACKKCKQWKKHSKRGTDEDNFTY